MTLSYTKTSSVHLGAADWPPIDQSGWCRAHLPAGYFGTGGLAAQWSLSTNRINEIAYGRFLQFQSRAGQLIAVSRVGERVGTEDQLRPFFDMLVDTLAPLTVKQVVSGVSAVVRVTDPTFDRQLLLLATGYFNRWAQPVKDVTKRLLTPAELFQLGLDMMREAETSTFLPLIHRAVLFRDGLLVAFLSLIPIRLKNAQALREGEHLDVLAGSNRIWIPAQEMKVKTKNFEAEMPDVLVERVATYWNVYRKALAWRTDTDEVALWLTTRGTVMTAHTLYDRIKRIMWERKRKEFSVHNFRHAAATFIADVAPMKALMIAGVLGHSGLRTATKHYIKGKQRLSFQLFQEQVGTIMKRHSTS